MDKRQEKGKLIVENVNPCNLTVEKYIAGIIEDNDREKIEAENPEKTHRRSGFIDRRYGCSDLGHHNFAQELREQGFFKHELKDSEIALDNLGWARISMNRLYFWPDRSGLKLTKKQKDTVFDFFHGKKIIEFEANTQFKNFSMYSNFIILKL